MLGKRVFRIASLLMIICLMALVVSAQDRRRHRQTKGVFIGGGAATGAVIGVKHRRRRTRRALIGAGAGAAGGTARSAKARRRHRSVSLPEYWRGRHNR